MNTIIDSGGDEYIIIPANPSHNLLNSLSYKTSPQATPVEAWKRLRNCTEHEAINDYLALPTVPIDSLLSSPVVDKNKIDIHKTIDILCPTFQGSVSKEDLGELIMSLIRIHAHMK
jgi:hypothetical protein